MSKQLRLPKFWVLATAQVALVTAAAVFWFYLRTRAYLAGPPDSDLYAWSWGFQWLTFATYWLPGILLCTAIVLTIKRATLIPHYRDTSSRTALPSRHGS